MVFERALLLQGFLFDAAGLFQYSNGVFEIYHAGVAKWQTHETQNLAMVTSCRFESDLRHHTTRKASYGTPNF